MATSTSTGQSLATGSWNIAGQADLNGPDSDAAMSYSGGTMAFIRFHMAPGSFDIYLAGRTGRNSWDRPVAFERNSPCQEDNPEIYAGGTKMIFESSRIAADGSRCDPNSDNKSLWFSQLENGSWTMPTALTGPPSVNEKNTQPWVDEGNRYLYWTADKECACASGGSVGSTTGSSATMRTSSFRASPDCPAGPPMEK